MPYSPRNIKIACNHAGLTHYGGVYFFHEFLRVLPPLPFSRAALHGSKNRPARFLQDSQCSGTRYYSPQQQHRVKRSLRMFRLLQECEHLPHCRPEP